MLTSGNKKKESESDSTYIIAEIGINHNGKLDIALEMLEKAAEANVDAVKIQIITADKSYTKDSKSYSIFKNVELSLQDWKSFTEKAGQLNVEVFSTFVNQQDLELANKLDFPLIKISSTNITNFLMLGAVARLGKPVLISTGMAYLSEVDEAVRYLEAKGQKQIAILQCTSLYPTEPSAVNLRVIPALVKSFPGYTIGFSDHTEGVHCAVAAVALGARIIEKHFTLDRTMDGPDHYFSSNPEELAALVKAIREVEKALGDGKKVPSEREMPFRSQLQRSLVAARPLNKGTILTEECLTSKRSNIQGILPRHFDIVLGRKLKCDLAADEPLTWEII